MKKRPEFLTSDQLAQLQVWVDMGVVRLVGPAGDMKQYLDSLIMANVLWNGHKAREKENKP